MTSRRSFFKSLGLIAGAISASPLVFVPKFEPVRWKRGTWKFCTFTDFIITLPPKLDDFE